MIVRTYCDNGYKHDEDPINIELNDIEDIERGALENDYSRYNLAPYLTESGHSKIELIYPNFPWKSCYHGIRMITEQQLKMEKELKERHEMIVDVNIKAHKEGKLAIGKFYGYNDLPITKELLLKRNWKYQEDSVLAKLTEEEKELLSEGICCSSDQYVFTAKNKNQHNCCGCWYLTMRYDLSNTVGRNWSCHIDNALHEGVACVDIETIEHFNDLMKLMDIEYRL